MGMRYPTVKESPASKRLNPSSIACLQQIFAWRKRGLEGALLYSHSPGN